MLLPAMAYIDIEYVERYKAKAKGKERKARTGGMQGKRGKKNRECKCVYRRYYHFFSLL